MSKDTGPPGHPPAVTTCIEFYGARPITIRDSEVAADFIINYDDMYADTSGKYPQWDYDAVLPGPRSLLEYGGKK